MFVHFKVVHVCLLISIFTGKRRARRRRGDRKKEHLSHTDKCLSLLFSHAAEKTAGQPDRSSRLSHYLTMKLLTPVFSNRLQVSNPNKSVIYTLKRPKGCTVGAYFKL